MVYVIKEFIDGAFFDLHTLHFAQFKMSCLHNVGFFYLRHAVPEECCLTEMVFKTLTPFPDFISFHLFSMMNIAAHLLRSRHRASASYGVRSEERRVGKDGQ